VALLLLSALLIRSIMPIMIAVPIMPTLATIHTVHTLHHEEHHQRTEEEDGKWQEAQQLSGMPGNQKEGSYYQHSEQHPGQAL